jgi:tetratricopeptide (TPR) repeat protein
MKQIGLKAGKMGSALGATLLVILAMAMPSRSMAQMPAPTAGGSGQVVAPPAVGGTAAIHGHVLNAAGIAVNKGEIRLSTDRTSESKDRKYSYKFPLDQNGDYKGSGIAPGNYVVFVFQDDKSVDFNDGVILANKEDKLVDFDMSRPEYIAKMSPEDKKVLEEYKKKNAEIVAGNAKIQNLNALLTEARADNKAGDYDKALAAMQQATAAKPDEGILWLTMGDSQMGSADAAVKAAKAAGTSTKDPAIMQKYTDAAASYKKGIDLNAASKKPSPEVAATAYNQLGQSYGKMGNAKDSADAYEMAAKSQPASASMYYFNEAATLYNAGKLPEAEAAADKAIAADPKKADAYYIKGQALITQATVDPKTQKIVAPPGCVEAYQTYLELAPDGPHAADVKGILDGIGAQVKSSYKAGKK